MMKLNRFLFFPDGSSLLSPPCPSPSPSPDHETVILDAIFERLREWTSTTNITLRPDVFFSLLDHNHVLGATKAGTIATLVLVGTLFLLSLFFFPGPTLVFLRWLAVSCFYFCVFVLGLVWFMCRGLFIALVAICRCLLSLSDDCLIFTGRNSASRDAEYTRLFSGQATVRVIRRPSFLPENRFQQGAGVRYTAPPENRPERGAGVPGNRCSCGAHGKAKAPPNYFGERSDNIYRDREKMKETDEYRRAMEAEWAARQQELNRQAEEARRQRSKKAENKRRKANERRQNQRTDQKKAETSSRKEDENLNQQKDKIRDDIRQKLRQLQDCGNMASLLRSLGIHLPSNPSSNQIRAAYRQACKKFHPDRLVRADVRHQIEAEEKFKLISAMKDKISSL